MSEEEGGACYLLPVLAVRQAPALGRSRLRPATRMVPRAGTPPACQEALLSETPLLTHRRARW
jgi:hypothetical protein